MKLTKALINTASCPAKGQVILRDSTLPGFGVRLTPTCKSFIVEGVLIGTRKRVTLGRCEGMNIEQARKEAQKILADWKLGIDLSKMPPVPTLSEVLDCFIQERSMKLDTKKSYRSLIERSMPDWLKLPVNALSKEMILSRHQALVKPTRCGTENRACANAAMQVLRCLLNFAASKYDLAGLANPTEALKYRWYRVEARQGVIPDAALPKFYSAVMRQPKIARDFILLLLFTCLRRNEGAALKWANVDFAKGTLTIEAESNKSNRIHTLPLTPIITAILQSRLPAEGGESAPSEFVFPGRYEEHINEPRAVLAHLRAEMGWHWILHDLRRTALSAGEKAGVPFLALQKIANHVIRREVTDQYLILDSEFLRAHMEVISSRLLELMETSLEAWQSTDRWVAELPSIAKPEQPAEVKSVLLTEEEEVYF